ncbi:hypothetical protein F2Q70_00031302 [Brassica cretica]|uniref:Uncharacterized protein n=1 Tax=Brassica cretica TaxID=69181 RepID=A0A8S9FJ74_BRACR|nr:hypothetical protein F2Q70_00031302 [Brassica cretica]
MEDKDFGQTSIGEEIGISIDGARAISNDKSIELSVDNAHQTSIDNTPPEAVKYSLTNDANERVVLGKPKGQLSNANNQITSEQGTEIPVQIKSISERDNEWKLPLQDYLNPGRTYSNRGVNLHYQITLDTDSEGNFSTRNPEEAKRLIKNIATGSATANKRETGRLPGRTNANPKRQVNAVLLRSGKRLIPRAIEINNTEKHVVVEETGESRSRPIGLDDPSTESEIPRGRGKPNTEEEAIELEEEGEIEEDAKIDRQERTSVDQQTTVNIDRHSGNNVDRLPTPSESAIERVYRILPPIPPNKTQTKRELDKAICKKAFDKITLEMPLISIVELKNIHD